MPIELITTYCITGLVVFYLLRRLSQAQLNLGALVALLAIGYLHGLSIAIAIKEELFREWPFVAFWVIPLSWAISAIALLLSKMRKGAIMRVKTTAYKYFYGTSLFMAFLAYYAGVLRPPL